MEKKYSKRENQRNRKNVLLIGAALVLVILISMVFVSAYKVSYPSEGNQYSGTTSGGYRDRIDASKYCKEGNDFIFQIKPLSCSPQVVRSDLLEEQDVPVYCTISATQLNPLLDVKEVESLSFSRDYPRGVKTIGFQPKRAALGYESKLDSLVMEDIGSAVIVLRRQPNESAMPDYVEGNLTARMRYDVDSSFGIGRTEFYLPTMSDSEWNDKQRSYSFWNGKGYLRAESVQDDNARISIYSDRYDRRMGSDDLEKIQSFSQTLSTGEKSGKIYLSGFDPCRANLQLELKGTEDPETTARLRINSDSVELKEGEEFLEGNCRIRGIEKQGLLQRVRVFCDEDDRGFLERGDFELIYSPSVELEINGQNGTYEIGDKLYEVDRGNIYLGYVGTESDKPLSEIKREDLFAGLYFLPEDKERLTRDDISRVSSLVEDLKSNSEGLAKGEKIWSGIKSVSAIMRKATGRFYSGRDLEFLAYEEDGSRVKEFKGTEVSILNFGGVKNQKFSEDASESDIEKFEEYYENAMGDYDTLIESYSGEEDETGESLGQRAMREKISLADNTGQKVTVKKLCREFDEKFSSEIPPEECKSEYKFSSSRVSGKDVLIDGRIRRISFDGVYEPTYEEYGAEITVNYPEEGRVTHKLRKEQRIYLDEEGDEFIQLEEVDREDGEAVIRVRLEERGSTEEKTEYNEGRKTLSSGSSESFLSNYEFILQDINQKKVAHVELNPNIDRETTESKFNFRIDIEKRAFQMSPEKSREKAKKINNTIETLKEITNTLDDITQGMKGACLATRGYLTVKSFLENAQGEGEARTIVMRGEGGWNEYCSKAVDRGDYGSEEQCFNANSEEIDSQVNRYTKIMNQQDEELKDLQEKHMTDKNLLGESFVNTSGFVKDYSQEVNSEISDLDESYFTNPDNPDDKVDKEGIKQVLEGKDSWENKQYTMEELKKIEMYSQALKENPEDETAKKELFSVLKDIDVNSENYREASTTAEKYGLDANDISLVGSEDSDIEERNYRGRVVSDIEEVDFPEDIDGDTPVQIMQDKKEFRTYFLVLNGSIREDAYPIARKDGDLRIYNSNGELAENVPDFIENSYFKKYDAEDYKNSYNNPELKYYETGKAKGLPAIVPFDTGNGWYAAIEKSMTLGSVSRGYDESGRVNSFWLCNVGGNGMQEFNSGLGDDVCQKINPGTGQPLNQFPGLDENEASRKIQEAVNAIEDASRHYDTNARQISIGGEKISVGSPYSGTPETRCTDFLSPDDCNLLYNVCDPVLCPSSRCDFGGNYPVQDPVQSGIIGSVALCLPNFPDVKIPVCLTGLKAGMENLVSVFESYQSCLQTNAETGQTVGICDEITSVYMCDLFWKEAVPLAKYGLSTAMGQDTGGGGEYFSGEDLWQDTQETYDFMTKEYSEESHRAFQTRSTKNIGVSVCKSFISGTFPSGGELLDTLTETRSPAQFSGKFEEMPMTTETNPPMSHYKVTFHIYAGKDQPANYRVYLKGGQSSYYQNLGGSGDLRVDSDYIEAGGQVSRSRDITGPSGYNQMCIIVNGQEECGFEKVSTSFAVNRLKDREIERRVTESSVTTEEECVSGERAVSDFLNTNVQQGISEGINPEISDKGITRVCSTQNPGQGTDPNANAEGGRWKEVGYCGEEKVKCWLDTRSVEKAIRSLDIKDRTMDELENQSKDMFVKEGDYLTRQEFERKYKNISDLSEEFEESNQDNFEERGLKVINVIDNTIDRIYYNDHKSKLYLERGQIYGGMARRIYEMLPKYEPEEPEEPKEPEVEQRCEEKRNVVLNTLEEYEGEPSDGDTIGDQDRSEGVSCFDATLYLYNKASVDTNCVYTDGEEKQYDVEYEGEIREIITSEPEGGRYTCTPSSSENCQNSGLDEKEKLDLLEKGDMISYASEFSSKDGTPLAPHNAIFIEWENKEENIAMLFDWNGKDDQGNKVFRYYTLDISDDQHPVYQIWNPCSGISTAPEEEASREEGFGLKLGVSPSFEFRDGVTRRLGNVHYKYFDSQWHWSYNPWYGGFDKDDWTVVTSSQDRRKRELRDYDRDFVNSLENKSYLEGVDLLVDRTFKAQGGQIMMGLITSDPRLETDDVTLHKGEVFDMDVEELPTGIKFVYRENEDKWFWSFSPSTDEEDIDWREVSSLESPEGSSLELNEDGEKIVKSLRDKNFIEGADYIFGFYYEGPDSELGSYDRDEVTLNPDVNKTIFDDEELEIIKYATSCSDCQQENTIKCDEDLCNAIGIQIGEFCEYEIGSYLGGTPSCSSTGKRDTGEQDEGEQESEEDISFNSLENAIVKMPGIIEDNPTILKDDKYSNSAGAKKIIEELQNTRVINEREFRLFTGELDGDERGLDYILEFLKLKQDLGDSQGRETFEIYSAINSIEDKQGDYSGSLENEILIDKFYIDEILNKSEYENIKGEGGSTWFGNLFQGEASMEDIKEILNKKRIRKEADLVDFEECGGKLFSSEYSAYMNFLNDNNLAGVGIACTDIETQDNHIVRLDAGDKIGVGDSRNGIEDVSELANLKEVKELELQNNSIEDISALEDLENLEFLYVQYNCLSEDYDYSNLRQKGVRVINKGNPAYWCG